MPEHLKKWIETVKKVRQQNPNLTYKEALIEAKKIYKKN